MCRCVPNEENEGVVSPEKAGGLERLQESSADFEKISEIENNVERVLD